MLNQHEQFHGCLWVASGFYCSGTFSVFKWGLCREKAESKILYQNCHLTLLMLIRIQGSPFIPTQVVQAPQPSALGAHKYAGLRGWIVYRHEAMGGHHQVQLSSEPFPHSLRAEAPHCLPTRTSLLPPQFLCCCLSSNPQIRRWNSSLETRKPALRTYI